MTRHKAYVSVVFSILTAANLLFFTAVITHDVLLSPPGIALWSLGGILWWDMRRGPPAAGEIRPLAGVGAVLACSRHPLEHPGFHRCPAGRQPRQQPTRFRTVFLAARLRRRLDVLRNKRSREAGRRIRFSPEPAALRTVPADHPFSETGPVSSAGPCNPFRPLPGGWKIYVDSARFGPLFHAREPDRMLPGHISQTTPETSVPGRSPVSARIISRFLCHPPIRPGPGTG